jgi:hypothetical protein
VNFGIRAQGVSIQESHIFTANVVNQAVGVWTSFNYKQANNFAGVKDIASELVEPCFQQVPGCALWLLFG